eukprot:TRINITY_DN3239_c0_g1_i1.p1 TRINITY_DN3239_c0_g1~~TRINITY_DN3239_c0_g1_i1.p1  ORF type:complete len:372 (-),score=85.64 TRINITY_DN3239_c0_g1_i1:279-1394(-)
MEQRDEEDFDVPLAVPIENTSSPQEAVGVTIITGYLGAGKSTLVNYILNANHGKKIAVILNEFGDEVGVERALINEGDGEGEERLVEEWVELPNGCVCCTVKNSFVQALEQLIQQRHRFHHILLETTGLANPGPVASLLWLDDELESSVRLDSIVTVVDAKNLRKQLNEQRESGKIPEVFLQIAFADVVLLNKVDLISKPMENPEGSRNLEDLKMAIQSINSLAEIIYCVRCKVDLDKVLHCKAYDLKHLEHLEMLLPKTGSQPLNSYHDSEVKTLSIVEEGQVVIEKVNRWIESLIWEGMDHMDIYRCKGVLDVSDSDEVHILQAVRDLYEIAPGRKWKATEKRVNKIVLIGRRLNLHDLCTSFKSCIAI